MTGLETLLIATGLAADASAVTLGVVGSGQRLAPGASFRLPFHFGLFQALMPLAGWSLGIGVSGYVQDIDHWVAFVLLSAVGGHMVRAGLGNGSESFRVDPSRGWTLVMLSVATSIDAFAVGLTLAMIGVEIWYPALTIGIVTGCLSLLALRVGRRVGRRLGKPMELGGGLLLIGIGLRILISHLSA